MTGNATPFSCFCEKCHAVFLTPAECTAHVCPGRPVNLPPPDRRGPTRADLLQGLLLLTNDTLRVLQERNAAYAGEGDVFGNPNLVETLSGGKTSTETGIVLRLGDKISRLYQLVANRAPEADEKLEDTLRDVLGYTALLYLRVVSRDDMDFAAFKARLEPALQDLHRISGTVYDQLKPVIGSADLHDPSAD